jgi:hypothetical protein
VYRKKEPTDRADDLVQSFIEQKILQRNLLGVADPGKGKLRTLLLTALDRFWIDSRRKEASRARLSELPPDAEAPGPADVGDVAWAMQVLIESVKRMRCECESKQRPDLWGVFAGRTLALVCGAAPVPYDLLADRLGLDSGHQAANRYPSAQAMFRRNLQAELAGYAAGDVEAEMAELRHTLSRAGPELLEQLRIHLWNDVPEVTVSTTGHSRIDSGALTRLLDLPPQPADFAALLRHALTAPAPLDLGDNGALAAKARAWAEGQGLVLQSCAALLHHPNPLPELLELVKEFAKDHRADAESPLPPEVATVLYYASIAVALSRCGRRISRYDDASLRQGFQWGCAQPWVDEATRGLLQEGLRVLGATAGPAR